MNHSLSKAQVERFSRQILVPDIGVEGQERISKASVLVVGAGGLGSPVALQLVLAGIGRLGIVDYDCVEISNLHRQILHTEASDGLAKVESARQRLLQHNSACHIQTFAVLLTADNVLDIFRDYNVIVDASDNPVTRYLVNDAAVILGKPLVSGAALQYDGQLSTYNYNAGGTGGPCYRCIYPVAVPKDLVVNCDSGGVLGPVTGTIGSLQALEVLRIVACHAPNYSARMLLFSGQTGTFRTVRLRGKRPDCAVCGDAPTIKRDSMINYELFCGGSKANDKSLNISILSPEHRVTCQEYHNVAALSRTRHLLIDVRPPVQFQICAIPASQNVPIDRFKHYIEDHLKKQIASDPIPVYVVCRRGNDSQIAVQMLHDAGISNAFDLIGGLQAYTRDIDPSFPKY